MHMDRVTKLLVVVLLGVSWLQGCDAPSNRTAATEPAPVLMICQHGSVKSLMAASLFNREAEERHLPFRAIARGITPDAAVPPAIAEALAREGFPVKDFVPQRVGDADFSGAFKVVAISIEPTVLKAPAGVAIETWADVPAASVNYDAARASLQQHVDALLTTLATAREN